MCTDFSFFGYARYPARLLCTKPPPGRLSAAVARLPLHRLLMSVEPLVAHWDQLRGSRRHPPHLLVLNLGSPQAPGAQRPHHRRRARSARRRQLSRGSRSAHAQGGDRVRCQRRPACAMPYTGFTILHTMGSPSLPMVAYPYSPGGGRQYTTSPSSSSPCR